MIQHVAFEIAPDSMVDEGKFWLAMGFERVTAPPGLGEGFEWYEREGTQVHLMRTEVPAMPASRGHVAVVTPDFEETLGRLRSRGFEAQESRILWGSKRAKAKTPAGHLVELMEFPPQAEGSGR